MAVHLSFLVILFVADSLAVNKIPISTYKKLQGLSTYNFAKSHLYRKQQDFDQVDGGGSHTGPTSPSGSRPSRPHGQPTGPVRPGLGLQTPQGSGSRLESGGLRRETYPGESLIFTEEGSIQSPTVMAQSLVAEPAGCTPLPQPVRLPPDLDPMVIYFPSCVMINKCTGCCSHDSISCQATSRRNKPVQVMKARYTGGEQFAYEGTVEVMVEEDEACDCLCSVQATACTPSLQWYDSNTCGCRCSNEHLASSCTLPLTWSESQCACTCPPVTCSPGYTVHGATCRCLAPFSLIDSVTSDPCVASKRCRTGFKAATTSLGCMCRRQRSLVH